MATIIVSPVGQSSKEVRQWDFYFTNDLPTGVTIASATATHVPPSGAAVTPTVGAIVGPGVPVALDLRGTTALGIHVLICVATDSAGMTHDLRVQFPVEY